MAKSASGMDFSMVLKIAYGLASWVGVLVGIPITGVEVIQGHSHIYLRRQLRIKCLNGGVTRLLMDEMRIRS
jgi:hypothetical protein